ncbi:MAG: hypothetical protein ACM30G_22565 [Micromonosporaceae bacterium]
MGSPTWRIVILRAWRDADGLRIRVLTHDHPERQWIVNSLDACHEILDLLFSELTSTDTTDTTNG